MALWEQLINWVLDFLSYIGDYLDFFLNFRLIGVDLSPQQLLLGSGFLVFMGFAIVKLISVLS